MFNETNYLSGSVWEGVVGGGYAGTKKEWKQAGKPLPGGGSYTPVPDTIVRRDPQAVVGAPDSGGAVVPVEGAASGGGLLSGIPSTYLLIGAAIIALMMFKK